MTHFYVWLDGREQISKQYMRGYRPSFSFEGYSGADCVITPLDGILSQDNLQQHLDSGAIMLQNKHSLDFPNSILDGRLFESIARMNTYNAEPYQRGLLLTGKFERVGSKLYVDGRKTSISWASYFGAWDAWVLRGGVVYPPIPRENIQDFIDGLANKAFVGNPLINRPASRKRKKFKPAKKFSKNMRLSQKVRLAGHGIDEHDMRHILINFDAMNNNIVQEIYKHMKDSGIEFNMSNFVTLALSDEILNIKGVGKVTANKIRKQLGY